MARVNIHGAEFPISKVFSGDFVFTIPTYQRPYAWRPEQAGELLDDLVSFMGDGNESIEDLNPYFLGSIVLIKGDSPSAQVIDGQQRLTTLTILLAVLRARVPSRYVAGLTRLLYDEDDPILGIPNRYRLTLRSRDTAFFQKYIQLETGIAELQTLANSVLPDAQRNIRDNALLFLRQIEDIAEDRRVRLAQFIVNRCFLVVVSTPDLDSAYRIFSVLNDRGMDLSYTDILKAEVIGKLPEGTQAQYASKWEDIEDSVGREAFQEIFAHIRMIFRKVKAKDTILKEIRQYVRPADNPIWFVDEVLSPYTEAYFVIKRAEYESVSGADAVNRALKWLNRIDNFDWFPPAMRYLAAYSGQTSKIFLFFTELERLAAALMILRTNINKRIERYGQLLTAIESDDDLFSSGSPLQLTASEIAQVVNVIEGDVYQHEARLYILLRLDAALSSGEATYEYATITVEHVLPQNPPPESAWTQWFPAQNMREGWVHRLANLVLLSRRKNSAAQNFDFDKKKTLYFTSSGGVASFALTTQVLNRSEWTPAVLEQREPELVGVLMEVWRLR